MGYTREVAGIRYRLTSTLVRAWLFYAGFFGLFMGINKAVDGDTLWSAVLFGVITGVLFGSLMARFLARSRPEALRELPDADRQTVVRTVLEGTTVEDARLAPPIIAYAKYRRRGREQLSPGVERTFCGLVAVFFGYLAVTAGVDGRSAPAVWNAVLAVIVLVTVFVLPRQRERELQRADHAEGSARALLDRPG